METSDVKAQKKVNVWMIISIILFIGCAVLTGLLISSHNKINEETTENQALTGEKAQLIKQLTDLQNKYDQLSKDNASLSDLFEQEKEKVQKLMDQIKSAEGSLVKYKKRVAAMESQIKDYEKQIQELKDENKELIAQNIIVKSSYDSTLNENQNLQNSNADLTDKVNKGSVLTAYDIVANGLKKSFKKEVPTLKAKRTEKISVNFTIGKNSLTPSGQKDVYIRIADPAGSILCKGSNDEYSFDFQGKKIQYSIKESIDYQNEVIDRSVYWEKTAEFTPGIYIVDIFVDGSKIGTSTFTLQ
jgi:uncharacterized coiled-coil DUF342 family protein